MTLIAILAVLMAFVVLLLRQVSPPVTISLLTVTCTLAAGLARLVFSRNDIDAGAAPPTRTKPSEIPDAALED